MIPELFSGPFSSPKTTYFLEIDEIPLEFCYMHPALAMMVSILCWVDKSGLLLNDVQNQGGLK